MAGSRPPYPLTVLSDCKFDRGATLYQLSISGASQSPVARNLSNLYKSNKSILKDLKGFVRFLSRSDTHFQMFSTSET